MTKEELLQSIEDNLPDNDNNEIAPGNVRIVLNEVVEALAAKSTPEDVKSSAMPKGCIVMWGGAAGDIPTGFVLCDGRTVSDYGAVPDLRNRFIVGFDPAALSTPADTNAIGLTDALRLTENYGVIGNKGGAPNVKLTVPQMPAHTHSYRRAKEQGSASGNSFSHPDGPLDSVDTGSTGGDQPHENRPPYYVLAFIIKVV
jgi:microcystin-dependent protein